MRVVSWNIKSLMSAVRLGGNARDVIERIILAFDVVGIYEIPNTTGANATVGTLIGGLQATRDYHGFCCPSGGLGKENDQVLVFADNALATVTNTSAARRGGVFAGMRAPAYFNVTNTDNGNVREFCAWHAPSPGRTTAHLIPVGWQRMMQRCVVGGAATTALVMGDFNNDQLLPPGNGAGSTLARRIPTGAANATTLVAGLGGSNYLSTQHYRSGNTYDNFYWDSNLAAVVVASGVAQFGVIDVLSLLVTGAAPFDAPGGGSVYSRRGNNPYGTPDQAYAFYLNNVSDHLPVWMEVDF
jgi:hypothetical protein